MKIMKKFYLVFLVLGMFVGFLSSCDDDDKYRPDALELEIVSKSGAFTVAKEDTLFLKVKLNNPQEVKFSWTMNGNKFPRIQFICLLLQIWGTIKLM